MLAGNFGLQAFVNSFIKKSTGSFLNHKRCLKYGGIYGLELENWLVRVEIDGDSDMPLDILDRIAMAQLYDPGASFFKARLKLSLGT